MRSFTKYVYGLALIAAVTVHAQGTPATPTKAPAKPIAAKLTLPEMKERAAALDTQLLDDSRHMLHLQEVARTQKDVVKLTCVNERLVELKAQMNMFDTSRQQFTTAAESGADAARPSFVDMTGVGDTVKSLRGEAEACIGVPDLYKQESDVEVTHPPFPDDPTVTDPFVQDWGLVEPPAYASPFI